MCTDSMNELQKRVHDWAERRGLWPASSAASEVMRDTARRHLHIAKLMHAQDELNEAKAEVLNRSLLLTDVRYEKDEDGIPKPCGYGIELADALLLILDMGAEAAIDLGRMIELKMQYNLARKTVKGPRAP